MTLTYKVKATSTSIYLNNLLMYRECGTWTMLRSTLQPLLHINSTFNIAAPTNCNSLLTKLQQVDRFNIFQRRLDKFSFIATVHLFLFSIIWHVDEIFNSSLFIPLLVQFSKKCPLGSILDLIIITSQSEVWSRFCVGIKLKSFNMSLTFKL